MVFKVFFDDFISDVTSTPCTVADSPEVFTPVPFLEFGEFLLDKTGGTTFESLHEFRDGESRGILNVHMDMILAHYSLEYSDIFRITDLHNERATAVLNVSFKDWIAVLSDPDEVDGHTGDGVSIISLGVGHVPIIPSTESLALKCIV